MRSFYTFLISIRWQDIVDIIFNTYILFRLYAIFRGTTVFRVLIGIALLWFFQRIAVSLGLIITSWAMQGITAAAAIIIIVVFRHEIRSVLQAKNFRTILWGYSHKMMQTPIEIIVESVFELAQRRIGALLVLKGKDDLEDVVHSGIAWEGLVSKEMIMSIFWHDNPAHDGAAIIQGDRVTEVGVILPLSQRQNLPSYYGTRHRAAIGLAEITDAFIIGVSEERGNVFVANDRHMRIINRKEELSVILQKNMAASLKQPSYLRKEKLELGLAALVSFFFISSVWFVFTRGLDTLITLDVPIEYRNLTTGVEIIDTSADTARLQLSGSSALIKSLRPEQIQVALDLGKVVVGSNTFPITNENISLPPGIFFKKVDPHVVNVTIEVPMKKDLPIQVDWVGKLPEPKILVRVRLRPETIRVIGDRRTLEKISTIYTEKVRLNKIKKSGSMDIKVTLKPWSLKVDPGSKDVVTIEYVVRERDKQEARRNAMHDSGQA